MPAKSKNQQQAAGMALAAKRGEMDVSDLKGAAKDMYDSMTEKELEDFAETEHKGLPDKVKSEGIIKLKDLIDGQVNEAVNKHQLTSLMKDIDELLYDIGRDCNCVHYDRIKKMERRISKMI